MSIKTIIAALLLLTSCTAAKLSLPAAFSSQATRMPVKGLNGWTINQKLVFGNYQTSVIRRGWDFKSSLQYTKFRKRPEEVLLKVLDIDTDHRKLAQRNKFQYTMQEGNHVAEVYATENFTEKQLVYKSNTSIFSRATTVSL